MEKSHHIAVIGMAGRFPGAPNVRVLWENLRCGVESIASFSENELLAAGVPSAVLADPTYVKAAGHLEGADLFDAGFFGFSPREAELTDPQQRQFLECAWEALEDAGYDSACYKGAIGMFAGAGRNSYLLSNLLSRPDLIEAVGPVQTIIGNEKDFVATRVSYKLNLTGPSVTVQTACSTSLVAVHFATQSLLGGECDMALAGGVSITAPRKEGYYFVEGGIASPDGHCRAFDAMAQGMVGGNGVAIVVLKRLEDALRDGDAVRAVILGSAVNNDGSMKIGYTAPAVEGQARVITEAQAVAGIEPASVTYVETHGTGTALGDPIEVAALTRAFRAGGAQGTGFCAIGSVKTNLGHLDAAAGVTGLIKAVLSVAHKEIPPSLYFEKPNPEIEFSASPFFVNTELRPWSTDRLPRRAGISSFGIGGTNAHVIIEEAPVAEPSGPGRAWQLLLLSAKSRKTIEASGARLAAHLSLQPNVNLADVGYTLHVGRRRFAHRWALVARNGVEAAEGLASADSKRLIAGLHDEDNPPRVVFMFPGQGAQHVNMGLELYQAEPTFRAEVDRCSEILQPSLNLDLREFLYPSGLDPEVAARRLTQTDVTQPALFVIEYALARLWMEWGIEPIAMIGHSVGEYVAATLAEIFSLEDALKLVATRGRLIMGLPDGGAMLAVHMRVAELQPILDEELSLAAINAPNLCVVSGPEAAVSRLEGELGLGQVSSRRLHTSHAFHSKLMEPILGPFGDVVEKTRLGRPTRRIISCATGTWLTEAEATSPNYWRDHVRRTVRFAQGVEALLEDSRQVLLEVGPGRTLTSLARLSGGTASGRAVIPSMRHPNDQLSDAAVLLEAAGRLWAAGVEIDVEGFYAHQHRRRVSLPTYPFEREQFWVEPGERAAVQPSVRRHRLVKNPELASWFYLPSWKRTAWPATADPTDELAPRLIFADTLGLGSALAGRLESAGSNVVVVRFGTSFARLDDGDYTLDPAGPEGYDQLVADLVSRGLAPRSVVHLASVTANGVEAAFGRVQQGGFYSLLWLAQALLKHEQLDATEIMVVASALQEVTGEENLHPAKATLLGLQKVLAQECPHFVCRSIDLVLPEQGSPEERRLVERLAGEVLGASEDTEIAYRGPHRWARSYEAAEASERRQPTLAVKPRGVYLITGGLGRVGLAIAGGLAESSQARLALLGRSALPETRRWAAELKARSKQDPIAQKIRAVSALEAAGAEVMLLSADVADERQVRLALKEVTARWGRIDGVIHAAGEISGADFSSVTAVSPAECEKQFRPKAIGAHVLKQVLGEFEPPDFCLLCSSLSSILGGLGFGAYAAANAFLDAFAIEADRQGGPTRWISVNWEGWGFTAETEGGNSRLGAGLADLAMAPAEGMEAFRRALGLGMAQVIVSTGDLLPRIEQWVRHPPATEKETPAAHRSVERHARPEPESDDTAPPSEVERVIASVWQELLGVERIGIHDNFFELGGNSLLTTQVVARLRRLLNVDLPLRHLFQEPTVAGLAERLRSQSVTPPTRRTEESNVRASQERAERHAPAEMDFECLIPMQPKGSRRPLFLVAGAHADEDEFLRFLSNMIPHLGTDQPVYGFKARGLDGVTEPHLSVEDMAGDYIREMRSVQPEGPYLLSGECVGGLVAYEMAQQLLAQGAQVGQLILMDTVLPDDQFAEHVERSYGRWKLNRLAESWQRLMELSPRDRLSYGINGVARTVRSLLPLGREYQRADQIRRVERDYPRILSRYRPRPYPGRLALIINEEEHARCPAMGWQTKAVGEFEVFVVPGDHVTRLTEFPKISGERLRACLDPFNLHRSHAQG